MASIEEHSLAKRQKQSTARRSFNFETVEGGYVSSRRTKKRSPRPKPQDDPKNSWDRGHLEVSSDLAPGHFTIWIAATDEDGHTDKTGSSACAWKIHGRDAELVESWPGGARESSEKKAYVAAVAGALDRLPKGSTAEIICREEYIVKGINGGAKKWVGKLHPWPGEKYSRQPYGLIWAHVLDAIKRISPPTRGIKARRPKRKDDKDDQIIEELKKMARAIRPSPRK